MKNEDRTVKLGANIRTSQDTLDRLQAYADRRGIKLTTAIAFALRSGLLRLEAALRYARSPKGKRTNAAARRRARGKS